MRKAKYGSAVHPRMTPIGPGMRVLFAVLGIAALVPVALISVEQFRALSAGSLWGPLLLLAFCAVVVFGALLLLLASIRGTAAVRRPSRKR